MKLHIELEIDTEHFNLTVGPFASNIPIAHLYDLFRGTDRLSNSTLEYYGIHVKEVRYVRR